MNSLKRFSILLIVFSYLFVGDYIFFGLPVFFVVWAYAILNRVLFQINFSMREVLLQIVTTLFFAPLLLRGANFGNQYEMSIVYALLFINIFPLILVVYKDVMYKKYFLAISVSFLVLTVLMYLLNIRSIVFGPNIFYRITGFSYIALLVLSIKNMDLRLNWLIIAYTSTLTTALATQSRGALLLSVILGLITAVLFLRNYRYKYIIVTILSVVSYILYLNINNLSKFFGRSAYFDTNNASEAARLDFLSYVIDYYQNLSFNEFLLGLTYPNKYFNAPGSYPHNLLLELFLSFGMLYFLAFLFVMLFSIFKWNKDQWLVFVFFLPIYFGSMFSGYFGDHSYLLLIPLLISFFRKKIALKSCMIDSNK